MDTDIDKIIKEIDADEIIAVMFAERLCDPLSWFGHARALIGSARISKEQARLIIHPSEQSELENVCSLLYGLALENLFKALWIYKKHGSRHYDDWQPEAKFPKEIKTHDLVKLASLIDPELAINYKDSLYLLSESAIWAGRYPCSINGEEGTIVRMSRIHDDAEEIYAKHRKIFTISS